MPADFSQVQALSAGLKAGSRGVKRDAAKIVRKSAKAIERGAKSRAPVGATEDLRDSIHAYPQGTTAQITAEIRYAVFNEYGTSKMSPQPFMVPALEDERPKFIRELEQAEAETIERAIGG